MAQKRVRLKRVRESAGFTQEDLAHKLRTDVSTVWRWEAGATRPSAWQQPRLAKLLGVTRAQLIDLLDDHADISDQGSTEPPGIAYEHDHLSRALADAGRYLDESVAGYFQRQLDVCIADDGAHGPTKTLPAVLAVVGVVAQHAREVKPGVRRTLLAVGARGAEFAGWLYRDADRPDLALFWRDRAVEWAQETGNWAMQGYILLKKSQSAWDERDGSRMLTLAQAAQAGPWTLPPLVRAEAAQQEARGLAMIGESHDLIERKLGEAWEFLGTAGVGDRDPDQLGRHYSDHLLRLQSAICHCEAGKPVPAIDLYRALLADGSFSYRDRGYFLSLMAAALAVAGEPDSATETGQEAIAVARQTNSQRTVKELVRVCGLLAPWQTRSSVQELRAAVLAT